MNHRVAILGGPGVFRGFIGKRLGERGGRVAGRARPRAPGPSLPASGAGLEMVSPALPLIGGGLSRFQPVYVGDVADAAVRCLDDPASAGRTYELGGPKVYTLRALMELLLEELRRKRLLIDVPFGIASLQARLMAILPNPPLTADQVEMFKRD